MLSLSLDLWLVAAEAAAATAAVWGLRRPMGLLRVGRLEQYAMAAAVFALAAEMDTGSGSALRQTIRLAVLCLLRAQHPAPLARYAALLLSASQCTHALVRLCCHTHGTLQAAACLFAMAALHMVMGGLCLTDGDCKAIWAAGQQVLHVEPFRFVRRCNWHSQAGALKLQSPASIFPPLCSRLRAETLCGEFSYDPTQRLFVVRAIARMAVRPYIPVFAAEQLMTLVTHFDSALLSMAIAAFDNPAPQQGWCVALCLVGLIATGTVREQRARIHNWRRLEVQRISTAIELAVIRAPLRHSGLMNEHVYWLGGHYPKVLIGAVVDVFGHVSALISAITTIALASRSVGSSAHMLAAATTVVAVQLCVPALRLLLEWTTAWCFSLQPYDIIDEICGGIASIKMYAWEERYLEWARTYHDDDGEHMYSWPIRMIRVVVSVALNIAHGTLRQLATLVAIRTYLQSQPFGGGGAKVDAQLLLQVQYQVQSLSAQIETVVSSGAEWYSVGEANHILEHSLRAPRKPTVDRAGFPLDNAPTIALSDCAFTWSTSAGCVLRNVSLEVNPGQLVVVTGPVGVGKSSLLQALCGEMELIRGSGSVCGRIALVSQRVHLIGGTIRDNVLFGAEYDQTKYGNAVRACALSEDFEQLPLADLSLAGQRGESVSGGQRMRIALARAVYSDADIYLLDDPLAAVDARVARELTERLLVGAEAALAGKTRVLVTSSSALLLYANHVVTVDEQGLVSVVTQTPEPYVSRPAATKAKPAAGGTATMPRSTSASSSCCSTAESGETGKSTGSIITNAMYFLSISGYSFAAATLGYLLLEVLVAYKAQMHLQNTLREARQSLVPEAFVNYYWMEYAMGILRAFLREAEIHGTEFIGHRLCEPRINTGFVQGLIRSPLSLFEQTQRGHIATSYYLSASMLREGIPRLLGIEISLVLALARSILYAWKTAPLAVLVAPIAAMAAFRLENWLRPAAMLVLQQSQAANSQYAHVHKSIVDNAQPIRLYQRESHFSRQLEQRIDSWTQMTQTEVQLCDMEVAIRNFIELTVTSAALGGLFAWQRLTFAQGSNVLTSAEAYGLHSSCRSMMPNIAVLAILGKRMATYDEFIGMHRRVAQLPSERTSVTSERPPNSWPGSGKIEFVDYSMRYDNQKQRALDGISLTIDGGEKIGIVGRTGAGKSSLANALFRIVEGESGKILIDGRDISQIPLYDLRSRLAIIPQDPALFHGSLRDNLDPLRQHTIEDIWAAIIKAQLVDLINRKEVTDLSTQASKQSQSTSTGWGLISMLTRSRREKDRKRAWGGNWCWHRIRVDSQSPALCSGLDKWIELDGRNFSIGQRQLVSLCRALLRTCKILVLDEATANVDPSTDCIIHQVIGNEFKQSTIITIAHRLNTVLNSDRIVVMDKGRIAQVGSPHTLLADANGSFAHLLRDAQ